MKAASALGQATCAAAVTAASTLVAQLYPVPLGIPYLRWIGTAAFLGLTGYAIGLLLHVKLVKKSSGARIKWLLWGAVAYVSTHIAFQGLLDMVDPSVIVSAALAFLYSGLVIMPAALLGFLGFSLMQGK